MFEKIKKVPKIYWLLLLVFLIGSIGIFYNYDRLAGSGDEPKVINSVLKFFRDFSLADKYPTFLPGVVILYMPFIVFALAAYLFSGLGNIYQLKELAVVDTYKFMPYLRLTTVIFGIVATYVFYKICLEIFKKERPSLIASYLLATSLIFVQQIHLSSWIVQTMMILISVYYSLILLKKQKWHIFDFIISALLIVLAAEIETVGLIAIVPFLLVCFKRRKDMKVSRWIINLSLFFSLIILGLVFFAYLNPVAFDGYFFVFNKAVHLGLGKTYYGRDIWGRILDPFWIIILLEPLLFGLALLGAAIACRKNKFLWKFFGLYAFLYYLILGPLFGGMTERRLLPIIPVLAVFAAFFIDFLFERYGRSSYIRKIIYCGLFIFLINPLIFDTLLVKKGSAIEAREWVYENLPANSSILDRCALELNENKEILSEIAKNYPSFLTTKRKYLLDRPALLENRKGYFVKNDDIINILDAKKFQYLVICYSSDEDKLKALDFLQDAKKTKIYDLRTNRKEVFAINLLSLTSYPLNPKNSGLLSLFKALFNTLYFGPNVEIYALK
jgi:hypothetical protein